MVYMDSDVNSAQQAVRNIEDATTDREALVHAFNGLGNLLMAILYEVRLANEKAGIIDT